MGLAKDKMGGDFSWLGAQCTEWPAVVTGVTAAGTTQGTAAAVTASVVLVGTATALQGVQIYNGSIGDSQWIFNDNTGTTIVVYPPTGNKINNLSTNSGIQLANNTSVEILKVTSTRHIAIMSA